MSDTIYIDEYEPPQISIWQRLNRLLWALLILAVVALIIGAFLPELEKQRNERDQLDKLQHSIDAQKALLTHHQHEVGWLQNVPEYLEIYARDKLDKMKDGETILRTDPPKPPALQPEPPLPVAQPHKGKSLN